MILGHTVSAAVTFLFVWMKPQKHSTCQEINPEVLIEFSTTEDGTIAPKELYEMAYQMAFDEEAKERIAALDREVSTGLQLINDDKAFYEKYRYKYCSVTREQDENTFAFWESEKMEVQALEKFKGGKGNDKKQ